jgi:hypothetical protein
VGAVPERVTVALTPPRRLGVVAGFETGAVAVGVVGAATSSGTGETAAGMEGQSTLVPSVRLSDNAFACPEDNEQTPAMMSSIATVAAVSTSTRILHLGFVGSGDVGPLRTPSPWIVSQA